MIRFFSPAFFNLNEIKMQRHEKIEMWALMRAKQIVLREGANLANSAQWLDKKKTLANSYELRRVIAEALIEASRIASFESAPTDQSNV